MQTKNPEIVNIRLICINATQVDKPKLGYDHRTS